MNRIVDPETPTRIETPGDQAGLGKVDRANGVIRDVSLITGGVVAKGYDLRVDQTTLEQVLKCCNAKGKVAVRLNHGSGIENTCGYLTNFRIEDSRVRADWHLLKSHREFNTLLELAEQMPTCYGLSVSFISSGDPQFARCEEILSVDCVTDPAANDGLFSAKLPIPKIKVISESMKPTPATSKVVQFMSGLSPEEKRALDGLPDHVRVAIEKKRKDEARKSIFRKLAESAGSAATGAGVGALLTKSPLRGARIGGALGGLIGAAGSFDAQLDNVVNFAAKTAMDTASKKAPPAKMLAGAPGDNGELGRVERRWRTYARDKRALESHSMGSLVRRLMLDGAEVEKLLTNGVLHPEGQDPVSGNLIFKSSDLDWVRGKMVKSTIGEAVKKFGRTTVASSFADRALRDQMARAAASERSIEFARKTDQYSGNVIEFGPAGVLLKLLKEGGKKLIGGGRKAGQWAKANPGKAATIAGTAAAGASLLDDEDVGDVAGSAAQGGLVAGASLGTLRILRKLKGLRGIR